MKKQFNACQSVATPKAKRIFDIVLSAIVIVLLSPLFIVIFLVLTIEQLLRGNLPSPFYTEKRISRGQAFNFLKFNIFKPKIIAGKIKRHEFIHTKELEHSEDCLTTSGQIIQKAYLDELPQLFNILKGDISFVGPRPVNLEVYKNGLAEEDYTRTVIRTGLTGAYQSHKGEPGANQRRLDIDYIKYVSSHNAWQVLFLDAKIILRTLVILLRAQGY